MESLGWQKQCLTTTHVSPLADVMGLPFWVRVDKTAAEILVLGPVSTLYKIMFKNWKEFKDYDKI